MKTIRVFLSALAITIAGAAVYANGTLVKTYYRSQLDVTVNTTGGAECFQTIAQPLCGLQGDQCARPVTIIVGGVPVTKTYWISEKDSAGPNPNVCVITPRD